MNFILQNLDFHIMDIQPKEFLELINLHLILLKKLLSKEKNIQNLISFNL